MEYTSLCCCGINCGACHAPTLAAGLSIFLLHAVFSLKLFLYNILRAFIRICCQSPLCEETIQVLVVSSY